MPMRFPNWIPDKRSDSRATTEPATSQNDKGHHSGWLIGTAQIKQQPEVEKDRLSALELLPEVELGPEPDDPITEHDSPNKDRPA
jgi:hypothetical protein